MTNKEIFLKACSGFIHPIVECWNNEPVGDFVADIHIMYDIYVMYEDENNMININGIKKHCEKSRDSFIFIKDSNDYLSGIQKVMACVFDIYITLDVLISYGVDKDRNTVVRRNEFGRPIIGNYQEERKKYMLWEEWEDQEQKRMEEIKSITNDSIFKHMFEKTKESE